VTPASRKFLAVPIALVVLIAQATCACARASLIDAAADAEVAAIPAPSHACCAGAAAVPHPSAPRDPSPGHDHSQPCSHCGTTASVAAQPDAGSVLGLAPLAWIADLSPCTTAAVHPLGLAADRAPPEGHPPGGTPLLALFCALNL